MESFAFSIGKIGEDKVIGSLFQSRFADALLRELAGVTIPPERIYGLGTGLVFDNFNCSHGLKY